MRRAAVAAGALAFAIAVVGACGADAWPRFGNWRVDNGAAKGNAFSVVTNEYDFPTTGPRLPSCSDGTEGACRFCAIGAYDGGQQWQCVSETGGHPVVVVDPGGNIVPSFIPGLNAREFVTGTDWVQMFEDGGLLDTFNKDGGTIVIAGYSRGGPSGFDYWLEDDPAGAGGPWLLLRGHGSLMEWFMGSQGVNPANAFQSFDEVNHNGWGIFTLRYTGGADAGLGSVYVMNVNAGLGTSTTGEKLGQSGGPTPGHAFNSPWYVGGRPTNDLWLNGYVAYIWVAPGERSDDWVANNTARFYGMPNADAGWTNRWISQSYRSGVDLTAVTGQVEYFAPLGFIVGTDGLHSTDATQTNMCNSGDPFDATLNPKLGAGTFVTANVDTGPSSRMKGGAECDRVTATVAGGGIITLDAGVSAITNWYDYSVEAKASDGGAVVNLVQLFLRSDGVMPDGGHEQDCLYTLSYDAGRYECRARFDGGTYVLGGAVAWDAGSFEICHQQFVNSPALTPLSTDTALRNADNAAYQNAPSSWPQPDAGGAVEFVSVVPYDPNADWSTSNDVNYAFDATQVGSYGTSDHSIAMIYGYTAPGVELVTDRDGTANPYDFQLSNISLSRFHSVATRIELTPLNANKCTAKVRQRDCGQMPAGLNVAQSQAWVSSCTAKGAPILAANTDPDAGCPAPWGYMTLGGRAASAAPSDTTVQAVRRYSR